MPFQLVDLLLQTALVGIVVERLGGGARRRDGGLGGEGDEHEAGGDVVGAADPDHQRRVGRACVDDRRGLDLLLAVLHAQQRRAQVDRERRIDREQQVVGRLAAAVAQVAAGALGDVDHLVIAADDDRRRREAFDQLEVDFAPGADAERLGGRPHGQERLPAGAAEHRQRRRRVLRQRARQRALARHLRQAPLADDERLVDAMPLVDGAKQVLAAVDRLGDAEEEAAARPQREVDDLERVPLRLAIEVDEEVAAADQVEAREGRVLQQVVRREDDHLADLGADAVAPRVADEEALEAVLGNVGGDRRRVDALAGGADRVVVEVGGEHLQHRRRIEAAHVLGEEHGDRVRLLAAGAGGDPDAHLVARVLAGEDDRQLRFEGVERLAIAEEVGDADQQVFQQRTGLAGVGAHEVQVGGQRVDAVDAHPPRYAAQDRRPLVVAEVAPGVDAHEGQQLAQRRLELGQRQHCRRARLRAVFGRQLEAIEKARVADQPRRHVGDTQHPVDEAGGDRRTRHARVLGLGRVLGDRQAAALLDALDADRAVAVGPRENDRRRARSVRVGQGAKEQVDGDAAAALGGDVGAGEVAVDRLQRLAGRDDVDVVRLHAHRSRDLLDRHLRRALQDLRQHAFVLGRQVHHHHEDHAGIDRRGAEEALQRGNAARGAAEADRGQHAARPAGHCVVEIIRQRFFGVIGRRLDARLDRAAVRRRRRRGEQVGRLGHGRARSGQRRVASAAYAPHSRPCRPPRV